MLIILHWMYSVCTAAHHVQWIIPEVKWRTLSREHVLTHELESTCGLWFKHWGTFQGHRQSHYRMDFNITDFTRCMLRPSCRKAAASTMDEFTNLVIRNDFAEGGPRANYTKYISIQIYTMYRGLGQIPGRQTIWCILALKYDILTILTIFSHSQGERRDWRLI